MPNIKNSTDIANEIVNQIDRVKKEFKLTAVSKRAAENVPIETDSNQAYCEGMVITADFQLYLSKVSEFVGSVSQKLDSADQQVYKTVTRSALIKVE